MTAFIISLFTSSILFGLVLGFSLPKDMRTRIVAIYKDLANYRRKEK